MFDWLRQLIIGSGNMPPPQAGGRDIVLPAPTVSATTPSDACIELIEQTEQLAKKAYPDVDGVYVLGYGCKIFDGKPVVAGQTTDADSADRNCRAHAQRCANAIRSSCRVPLTQGQLDALTDFVYNIGIGGLQQSTLLRTINTQQPVTKAMFTVWNKIHKDGQLAELPGLTRRRLAEYQLFIS